MDFEERARQRRRRMLKTVIAEVGMILSVIIIVVVATMASMGFFVSSDGTLEQNGLIQIHSRPSGATIELDGGVLFSHTNTSRTLSPGQHQIKLSKDGYDTWENTVNMYSGVLVRLYYPRIFLNDRTQEVALQLGSELEFYSSSNDHEYIVYAVKDSPKWQLVNIHDTPQVTTLDLSDILPGVKDGVFSGEVKQTIWDEDSGHVLTQVAYEGKHEWILVTLRNVSQSLNLTKTFGLDFSQVTILDDSASQLFALENGQLRKINTASQEVSRVLLSNIETFASYKTNAIYVVRQKQDDTTMKQIGIYRDGERGGTILETVANETTVRVALTRYYDDDYIIYSLNDTVSAYYGGLPSYRETEREADFSNLKEMLKSEKIAFVPDRLTVSLDGSYVVARQGVLLGVIDPETEEIWEYEAPSQAMNWLTDGMLTALDGDKIVVWDYDSANRRELVKYQAQSETGAQNSGAQVAQRDSVQVANQAVVADDGAGQDEAPAPSVTTKSPAKLRGWAIIADNNKWLYYLAETSHGITLMRERIL